MPPAMKLQPCDQRLRMMYRRGVLSDLEYCFGLLLLDNVGHVEADRVLSSILKVSEEELAKGRGKLKAKGLFNFIPGKRPGTFICRPLGSDRPAAFRPPNLRQPCKSAPRRSWVVFEQGKHTHLLREDDLFSAERTLCGRLAVDADLHPLPRFNSAPADYHVCRCCRLLHQTRP